MACRSGNLRPTKSELRSAGHGIFPKVLVASRPMHWKFLACPDANQTAPNRALSRRLGTCDLLGGPVARRMKKIDYNGYRFLPVII